MIEGIDISTHQKTTPSLTGKSFVIARATYGAHGDDRYLVHQIAVRRFPGKVFGAYHFSRPVSTGDTVAEQVRAFLLMAKDADLLALDLEEDVFIGADGKRHSNGTMTRADARAFIAAVHRAGRTIGLYTSESHFFDAGQDFDWVANWSAQPKRHWDIWQYNGSGTDHIDNDRFNGTVSQLRLLGGPHIPDTTTEVEVEGLALTLPKAYAGTATVVGDGHSFIRVRDRLVYPVAAGWTKQVFFKAELDEDFKTSSGAVIPKGTKVVGIGDDLAVLLEQEVKLTPSPDATPYSKADLDAAVAATKASAKVVFG